MFRSGRNVHIIKKVGAGYRVHVNSGIAGYIIVFVADSVKPCICGIGTHHRQVAERDIGHGE